MHNRDFVWEKKNGQRIKIRDMSSDHLCNTLNLLKTQKKSFMVSIEDKMVYDDIVYNFEQEIRLRKLNRLETDSNNELF